MLHVAEFRIGDTFPWAILWTDALCCFFRNIKIQFPTLGYTRVKLSSNLPLQNWYYIRINLFPGEIQSRTLADFSCLGPKHHIASSPWIQSVLESSVAVYQSEDNILRKSGIICWRSSNRHWFLILHIWLSKWSHYAVQAYLSFLQSCLTPWVRDSCNKLLLLQPFLQTELYPVFSCRASQWPPT